MIGDVRLPLPMALLKSDVNDDEEAAVHPFRFLGDGHFAARAHGTRLHIAFEVQLPTK